MDNPPESHVSRQKWLHTRAEIHELHFTQTHQVGRCRRCSNAHALGHTFLSLSQLPNVGHYFRNVVLQQAGARVLAAVSAQKCYKTLQKMRWKQRATYNDRSTVMECSTSRLTAIIDSISGSVSLRSWTIANNELQIMKLLG